MHGKAVLLLVTVAVAVPVLAVAIPMRLPEWEIVLLAFGAFLVVGLPVMVAHEYRTVRRPIGVERHFYASRLAALATLDTDVVRLGFIPIDEFLIATATDVVVRVFQLDDMPTYLLATDPPESPLVDAARGIRIELRSELDEGSTLTSSTKGGRGTPLRRAEDYLQILPGADLGELALAHFESLRFLESCGLRPSPISYDDRSWRGHYVEYVRDELDFAHAGWGWVMSEIGRSLRRAHRKYLGTIEEQVASGTTTVSRRLGGPRWKPPGEAGPDRIRPARAPRRPRRRAVATRYGQKQPHGVLASYRDQALVLGAAAALVASRQLWPKAGAARWTQIGPRWAAIHSLAVAPGGHVVVSADRLKYGDVHESHDGGATWTSWGIEKQATWSVAIVGGGSRVCVGLEGGLECRSGETREHAPTSHSVYWIGDSPLGLLTAGFPTIELAPTGELARTRPVFTTDKTMHGGAVLGDGTVLVVGTGVFASEDHGATFTHRWSPPGGPYLHAIAARGQRVFVSGGLKPTGLFRSDDGGRSFVRLRSPTWNPEHLLLPSENLDVVLLAASGTLRPGDLYLSCDGGNTWRALGCPGVSPDVVATDGETLYCGSNGFILGDGLWRRPLAEVLPP